MAALLRRGRLVLAASASASRVGVASRLGSANAAPTSSLQSNHGLSSFGGASGTTKGQRFVSQFQPFRPVAKALAITRHSGSSTSRRTLSTKMEEKMEVASSIEVHQWTPLSRRTGVLGMKMGMMQLWDDWGTMHVVTVVKVDCEVLRIRDRLTPTGHAQLVVGGFEKNPRHVSGPLKGEFRKAGTTPKRKITEFQVTPDALLPAGFKIDVRHFFPGQFIDIQGTTKGKGFAGVMKRWGFAGQAATHGVSKTHRLLGSTGACQDPGRVWKGKKMAGNMGRKNQTAECIKIYKIDVKRSLLFLKGSVPGVNGGLLKIRDSLKRPFSPESPPPFPTYVHMEGEETPDELVIPLEEKDPFDD